MLNLVLVRTLITLLQTGGFQAAADRLNLSQPAVTRHIQKLEEQLGVALVRRSRTGCEPTPQALAFLPYAQSLLRLNERALGAVRGDDVRVGASSNIGIYLLQPFLKTFLAERDPATFDLVIDGNPAIADKLEHGEIDVALLEWWDHRPGLQAQLWRQEPVVLIVHPEHRLAARVQVGRSDFSGIELLGGEPGTGTGRLLRQYFGDVSLIPPVSLQLGSTEAVKQAVKAGLGASLVLASAVAEEVAVGSLRAIPLIDPPLSKDLYVIWRSPATRAAPAPDFVTQLLHCPAAPSSSERRSPSHLSS